MGFVFGQYPQGNQQDGVGPSLDAEIEQEEKVGNSLDDVREAARSAMYEHGGVVSEDSKSAWQDWCRDCERDNVNPVEELRGFAKLDQAAHQDARFVSAAFEQLAMRPRYAPPPEPEDKDEHRAAARAALNSVKKGYSDYDLVTNEIAELDKRTQGGFANYVRQVGHLKSQIRDGSPTDMHRAAITALGRYDQYNGHHPGEIQAGYDLKRIEKLMPDIDPSHPQYDHALREATANVLQRKGLRFDGNDYDQVSQARSIALRERRRG